MSQPMGMRWSLCQMQARRFRRHAESAPRRAVAIFSTRQIRRGSRYRRLDLCQGRLQGGFLRVVERSLQHRAAFAFEPLKDLVRRDYSSRTNYACK